MIRGPLSFAIWAECFLFPRGSMVAAIIAPTTAAVAAASAAATTAATTAAAAAATTTLGECCHEFCILSHNFGHLFALLCEFGLEESKVIECRCGCDGQAGSCFRHTVFLRRRE